MAAALCRTVVGLTRRSVLTYQVRAYSDKPKDGEKETRDLGVHGMHAIFPPEDSFDGKVETPDGKIPSNLGHMLGEERNEILAELGGVKDQFDFDGQRVLDTQGTRDSPILVRAENDFRVIGCLCDEEQVHINYMVLNTGLPKRCMCGFWYKLIQTDSI